MKKILILTVAFLIAIGGLVAMPARALEKGTAEEISNQLGAAAGKGGADLGAPIDPRNTVAIIIKVLLTLVGTVLFVLNIYAGFLWMTAGGNDEQITKAKSILTNGTIGLVIVLSAYAITIAATNLASGRALNRGATSGNDPTLDDAITNILPNALK